MKKKSTTNYSHWRSVLDEIKKGFPSPWQEVEKDQIFENTFKHAISLTNQLKHQRIYERHSALKSYLGDASLPDYSHCLNAKMNDHYQAQEKVIDEVIGYFNGLPNWNHPFTMYNITPPPNTPSIIASTLGNLFNADGIEGDYSWNVVKTEIESGAMLADMMGWDPTIAGGVYTFGGTFAYLYALKLALTLVLGIKSRYEGVRVNGKILVSKAGHYAKNTTADWTGLDLELIMLSKSTSTKTIAWTLTI